MSVPAPVLLTDREWPLTRGDQLAVVHARGGALRSYTVAGEPVVDGWADDELPPAFNGAVLAPWPNRIRDGRWTRNGVEHQLPVNEHDRRNALHGLVAWTDWQLVQHRIDAVELTCRVPAQPGYPHELVLGVTWSLTDAGLVCELSARNVGHAPAPFGVATHPFFSFADRGVDDLTLTLPATEYLAVDDRLLPVDVQELAEPIGELRGVELDTAYTGLRFDADGRCRAVLSSDRGEITVWADEQFGWWQVYTSGMFDRSDPRYRRSVAIEAMTCGPDAFNSGTDLIELAAGESWSGRWGVQATLFSLG